MNTNEIQRMKTNIDGLISTNGFLSTTLQRNAAESLADIQTYLDKNAPSVIIEITANPNVKSCVFASISEFSVFIEEEEVLFDIDALFILNNAEYNDEKNYWLIQLTTTNKEEEITEKYIKYRIKQLENIPLNIQLAI
ncbi:unnamed protein product, partial [Didymodactylos carnosus]